MTKITGACDKCKTNLEKYETIAWNIIFDQNMSLSLYEIGKIVGVVERIVHGAVDKVGGDVRTQIGQRNSSSDSTAARRRTAPPP